MSKKMAYGTVNVPGVAARITQAKAGSKNNVPQYMDNVYVNFRPKYIEISEAKAGTVYLWIDDEAGAPPMEIPPLINRIEQEFGGMVRLEGLDNVGNEYFMLAFPATGSTVDIQWKVFA